MAKSLLKLKARKLRRRGVSVNKIAEFLQISKSSVSVWVRDIILSIEQLETLRESSLVGAARGRLKGALLQKERWNSNLEKHKKFGRETVGDLSDREILIAGLALYWGEGSKKDRKVQFCNADPQMIKFLLVWLTNLGIDRQDIRCWVGINEIHAKRDEIVRKYWSEKTGMPLTQFRKTSFKKVQNQKIYDNFNDHYGTFSVTIMQPSRFYGKIIGLIEGLSDAGLRRFNEESQRSSVVEQSFHKRSVTGSIPVVGTKMVKVRNER